MAAGVLLSLTVDPIVGIASAVALCLAGALVVGYRVVATLFERLDVMQRTLQSLILVRPLMGELPVDLGGWAVDAVMAKRLISHVVERRPRLVVECGSGSSTVLLAAALRSLGAGRVVAIDHESRFAARTRQLLRDHELSDWATVVEAPLGMVRLKTGPAIWYEFDPGAVLSEPIDLMFVDGPPGEASPRSRYPAVPVLRDHFAPGITIFLDDGDRVDEAWIARQWAIELSAERTYVSGGKGGWVISRGSSSAAGRPGSGGAVAEAIRRSPSPSGPRSSPNASA